MSRFRPNRQMQEAAIRLAGRYPKQAVLLLVVVGLVALGYYLWSNWPQRQTPPPVAGDGRPATFLFCSWNVENLFDDEDDPKMRDDMEDWFGTDPAAFRAKVDHLAEGLLKMNGGVGPDVACLVEVESERAVAALRDAVNAKLDAAGHGDRRYDHVLFRKDNTGRRIAPAVLTRLGVTADRTRKLGKRGNTRILEGHLHHNGHELVVIVAHWTSRLTDKTGEGNRQDYAEDCYGRVNEVLHANPDADVLVCGDFNDEFADRTMQVSFKATDDPDLVRTSEHDPRLLALFARWDRGRDPPGTIFSADHGGWSVFDHICVTRGLLDDRGWAAVPDSAEVFAPEVFRRKVGKRYEPSKFGNRTWKGDRGYSDHFPVTVRLNVAGAEGRAGP